MYRLSHLITLLLLSALLSACTSIEQGYVKPPLVYRIDIQQGNEINQEMLNKLRVGMDERQVKFIMGTPLLIDPFHPERWEYLYYEQEAGEDPVSRHITLYFKDKRLSHLRGDVKVTHIPVAKEEVNTERSINVPESYGYRGLFDRWFDDRPEFNSERPEPLDDSEETIADTDETTVENDAESELINTVDSELDIEETKSETVVNNEESEDPAYSLEQQEAEPEEKPGFFSRMWDKITGDEPDYEFLDPEAEAEQ